MKKIKGKKGFTLVELIVVIAVIGILAAVLIPTFGNVIENANKSSVQSAASSLATQLNSGLTQGIEIEIIEVDTLPSANSASNTVIYKSVSGDPAVTTYHYLNGTQFSEITGAVFSETYETYAELAAAKIPYKLLVAILSIDGIPASATVTFNSEGFIYSELKGSKNVVCTYVRASSSYTVSIS